jgi:hypothetical protein
LARRRRIDLADLAGEALAAAKQIATKIMVHWNGSTEQARAYAFAMPLLRLAGRVTVLTVLGGQDVPGPSADQVRK